MSFGIQKNIVSIDLNLFAGQNGYVPQQKGNACSVSALLRLKPQPLTTADSKVKQIVADYIGSLEKVTRNPIENSKLLRASDKLLSALTSQSPKDIYEAKIKSLMEKSSKSWDSLNDLEKEHCLNYVLANIPFPPDVIASHTKILKENAMILNSENSSIPGKSLAHRDCITNILQKGLFDQMFAVVPGKEFLREIFMDFSQQSEVDLLTDYLEKNELNLLAKQKKFLFLSTEFRDKLIEALFDINLPTEWNALSGEGKNGRMLQFANQALAENYYQLKALPWNAIRSINSLAEQIQEHGPLVVSGFFGQSYYSTSPLKVENVLQGRTVYFWGKNVPFKNDGIAHSIVIVAVKSDGKGSGTVYFVDPLNESDPADINKQKIFCMPFEQFISPDRLLSITNEFYGPTQIALRLKANYAYYNPSYAK